MKSAVATKHVAVLPWQGRYGEGGGPGKPLEGSPRLQLRVELSPGLTGCSAAVSSILRDHRKSI